jgi:hypothetical protein
MMADGHRFWARIRAASAAARLGRLLQRLWAVLQPELPTREAAADSATAEQHGEIESAASRSSELRQLQQREYLSQTRVFQDLPGFALNVDRLDRITNEYLDRFRSLWKELCRQWDPKSAGNMPAQRWIPALRDFREQCRIDISDEIHRQAIEQLAAQSNDWDDPIQRLLNQPYDYLMSCPVTRDEIHEDERTRRLLLRSELKDSYQVQHELTVDESPLLNRLPLFGLLMDQAPVQLGEGQQYIEVVAHEA